MGLGGPEEDPQRHHCCWTGRVGEREEEEECDIMLSRPRRCPAHSRHVFCKENTL